MTFIVPGTLNSRYNLIRGNDKKPPSHGKKLADIAFLSNRGVYFIYGFSYWMYTYFECLESIVRQTYGIKGY